MTKGYIATSGLSVRTYWSSVGLLVILSAVLATIAASYFRDLALDSDSWLYETIGFGALMFVVGTASFYARFISGREPERLEVDDEYVTLSTLFRVRRIAIDDVVKTTGGLVTTLVASDGTKIKTKAHDRPGGDSLDYFRGAKWDGGESVKQIAHNYDELIDVLKTNRSAFARELIVEPIAERNSGKGEVQLMMIVGVGLALVSVWSVIRSLFD